MKYLFSVCECLRPDMSRKGKDHSRTGAVGAVVDIGREQKDEHDKLQIFLALWLYKVSAMSEKESRDGV